LPQKDINFLQAKAKEISIDALELEKNYIMLGILDPKS
jgi:hypothetical protein